MMTCNGSTKIVHCIGHYRRQRRAKARNRAQPDQRLLLNLQCVALFAADQYAIFD